MNSRHGLLRLPRFALVVSLVIACAALHAADVERTGGPYVPTPQTVVDAMLDVAKVGPGDFVIDLGSGDGRIVLTAAERYQARGIGYDIDPDLVAGSNAEALKRGLAERVDFRQQDVLQAPIDKATVLTLYLLPGMMQALQKKLTAELKPGVRIVSHDFSFSGWKPDREVSVDVAEKYGTAGQWKSTLFYWVVPARVAGTWHVSVPALSAEPLPLVLEQQYQFLTGLANAAGKRVALRDGKLEGDRVSFRLTLPAGVYEFGGAVEAARMQGTVMHAGRAVAWSAVRLTPANNPQADLR